MSPPEDKKIAPELNQASDSPTAQITNLNTILRQWWDLVVYVAGGILAIVGGSAVSGNKRIIAYIIAAALVSAAIAVAVRSQRKHREQENAQKKIADWSKSSQRAAFRGLSAYREGDILPGTQRNREARRLVTVVTDPGFRFGVVSGDVGCGKTSLIQSEVRRLLENDNLTVLLLEGNYIREVSEVGKLAEKQPATEGARNGRVLIIDQFEQLMLRFPDKDDRKKIGSQFTSLMQSAQPWKIVCAIRRDYFLDLYDLNLAVTISPTLILNNFTLNEAREVIRQCADAEGLSPGGQLIDDIVADLSRSGYVRPPELQIVCTALTGNFSSEEYRESGRAKGILKNYLSLAIKTCRSEQMARSLLRRLCDFDRQVQTEPKTLTELSTTVGSVSDPAESQKQVLEVLKQLESSRLIVSYQDTYSLIHDYWVSVIDETTLQDRSEQERAEDVLKRALIDEQAGATYTLNKKQLQLVRKFASEDSARSPLAAALIKRSAIRLWTVRAIAAGIVVGLITVSAASWHYLWHRTRTVSNAKGLSVAFTMQRIPRSEYFLATPTGSGPLSRWGSSQAEAISSVQAHNHLLSYFSGPTTAIYSDGQRWFSLDVIKWINTPLPSALNGGQPISMSKSGTCSLYVRRDKDHPEKATAELWTVPGGMLKAKREFAIDGPTDFINSAVSAQLPDNCEYAVLLITKSEDTVHQYRKAVLWAPGRSSPVTDLLTSPDANIADVAIYDDQSVGFTIEGNKGKIKWVLWNLRTGISTYFREVEPDEQRDVIWASFSSDGRFITFSGLAAPRKIISTIDLRPPSFLPADGVNMCDTDGSEGLDEYVLWPSGDHGSFLWDATGNEPVMIEHLQSKNIDQCTVSGSRKVIAVSQKNGTVELWNIATKKKISSLPIKAKSLRWTLQGDTLFIQTDSHVTELFDSASAKFIGELPVEPYYVSLDRACRSLLVFSQDGVVEVFRRDAQLFGFTIPIPGDESKCVH